MDVTQFSESNFVVPELVKNSPTRTAVIIGDVQVVKGKFGDQIEMPVEMDGKKKSYGPNKDGVKNFMAAWGKDSKNWIGKTISFEVLSVAGKERVCAFPKK